jgi:hypothetical protein
MWESLPPWERTAAWESKAPETWKVMIEHIVTERRHLHRLAWADKIRQFVGIIFGFGSVVVMAAVAWHYVDQHQPLAGTVIFGAGTVSTVAIFVTGQVARRK